MDETKFYELTKAVVKTIKSHLPSDYHGEFNWDFHFRDGEIYKVLNGICETSMDVKRLK